MTAAQAQTVSAAAEQVSRSVDTVSAGSGQMGASIREISQNATQAAQVASEAVDLAAATTSTMSKLGESSAEIGDVIKVITAIAQQTNLLALNANHSLAECARLDCVPVWIAADNDVKASIDRALIKKSEWRYSSV